MATVFKLIQPLRHVYAGEIPRTIMMLKGEEVFASLQLHFLLFKINDFKKPRLYFAKHWFAYRGTTNTLIHINTKYLKTIKQPLRVY